MILAGNTHYIKKALEDLENLENIDEEVALEYLNMIQRGVPEFVEQSEMADAATLDNSIGWSFLGSF